MRSFLLLFIIFLSVSFFVSAQSPGGVATNNTMWLRSDIGVTSSTNIVSQWQELSGANVTGNFTVQSLTGTVNTQTGPTVIAAGINFNPYLSFDGFTNSLSSVNLFPGTSLVTNSNVTVFQVLNLRGGIVWLKWETDQVGATGRLGFENAAGNIRFDFPKAVPATAGQNVGTINVLNKHSLSTAYADAASSVNRLNGATNTTLAIPGPGNFAAATDKIVIGNENLINLPAQVDIAELIIYAATLSAADRNKIESYLAVKYGFTLDQAAANANDYTAADGTIIWNRAVNSGYANNITGIGRDDASGLSQKQSKSINAAALVTLYNGTYVSGNFPLLNSANTNSFTNDGSFVLAGDDAASTALGPCIFTGRAQRIQRIWKVSRKGVSTANTTIAIDQGSLPVLANNIIVSQDPTFPLVGTTFYALVPGSNNSLYRDVPLNDNDYFSFATDPMYFSFNSTDPTCSNPTGGGIVTTISGGALPLTYSWSPSGQTTVNLVNAGPGLHTLTVTQQGGCQATSSVTLNNVSAPGAPAVNPVSVCTGNSASLTVQSPNAAYTYNWYSVATGGTILGTGTSFTTPAIVAATTYYLEAVDGICSSIRTAVVVSLTAVTAPVVNGATICSGSTTTLSIQSPNGSYTYNWYAAATGGTALGTGTSFTTPALTTTTTYYAESINATCPSIRTAVIVNITTIPTPVANSVAVCPGNTATLFVDSPLGAYFYSWHATATGGTALATGISFTTPAVSGATIYYVESSNGTCNSIRTPVSVTLAAPLDTPRVTATTVAPESITFSWPAVAGAAGYEVSIDGGPYSSPGSGSTGLTHTVNGLAHSQTVTISVIALGPLPACGDSDPGHASATTYGDGFYVPSAFTPNGDTRNDILTPVIPGGFILEYFTVFNRWGQKVFTTKIVGEGWDGNLQRKPQPVGTYVWICRYHYPGGRIIDEKGTFTILR